MGTVPIITNPEERRDLLHQKAAEGAASLFPIISNKYEIHADNLRVDKKTYNLNQYKDSLLEGKTLSEPLLADLVLKDKTGKVVHTAPGFKLANLPYLTRHNTFIVDGSAYSVTNQLRTKPGVYTRVRRNEVPEVAFNLKKGANFKVTMDPETSIFKMEYGTSSVPLYPALKALGATDAELKKVWGGDIHTSNSGYSKAQSESAVSKLYERLVPKKEQSPEHDINEKTKLLRSYYAGTVMDPQTTKRTLGTEHSRVSFKTIADASHKLLNVFRNKEEHDDRDSLEFQTVHSVDDFVKERLQKGTKDIVKKIQRNLDSKKDISSIKDVMPYSTFDKPVKSLISQSTLSRTPDQINPMEMLDAAAKVTRLGEGGISSIRAVPEDTRDLHPTHLGVIDPVRSPESQSIGIDTRFAMNASKDSHGNIYTTLRDVRTGRTVKVSTTELATKTVAFPNQEIRGTVEAISHGKMMKVPASKVDYQLEHAEHMFGPSASLLPFVDNMQGNRALMGAKQVTQALPLKYRESPLVQPSSRGGNGSMHALAASQMVRTAPEAGTVVSVKNGVIKFKGDSGTVHDLDYHQNFPLNSKTFLHEEALVKPGDKVKRGAHLTESNFTKDGDVALGINARVAYMAYNGENTNDAVVVSESAAKKFTSEHMYKQVLDIEPDTHVSKKFWMTQFPAKYPAARLQHIDDDGLPKLGATVSLGDPLIMVSKKKNITNTDTLLGKLHSSFRRKYRDASETWDHEHPGVITDVVRKGNRVAVTVKMEAPALVGDKISNSYGGKGVLSRIVPDDQMPRDAQGRPIDILLAPTGVVSRINPAQLLETALGKVSETTGKKILVDNFDKGDRLKMVKATLKNHDLSDKETVHDPVTGRDVPNIMVGKQYFYKLFKSTDTNFGARGIGTYDANQQPARGGPSGAKSIGGMELNALLAHGATGIASEAAHLKSQKNEQWWNAFKLGLPLPALKKTFAVKKLDAMLGGSGVKVEDTGQAVRLRAMTDKDVKALSHGTITKAEVLRKKDLKPELGGLFDPLKTGGLEGEKWADITLSERIIKPAYMKPAATLLGTTEGKLKAELFSGGADAIHKRLAALDLTKERQAAIAKTNTASGAELDKAVKRVKYIDGLTSTGLAPHEAYMGKMLLVTPPKMRPVVPGANNQVIVSDANHLYRDVILADQKLKEMKAAGFGDTDLQPLRKTLYGSISASAGLSEPENAKLKNQGKKGFVAQIAGPKPSRGYFQEKLYGRPQDLSGRGTIAPDPSLKMDEIGLPEDTAWGMYAPLVIKRLTTNGYPAMDAFRHVENRTPSAKTALDAELKTRPVIFNRAPSLHRFSMLAAYPKLVPGKTIRINSFVEGSLGADFDGDAIQLHTPVTNRAIADAKNMTMDKLLFSDKTRNDLVAKPEMEAVIGLYESTRMSPTSGTVKKFKNKEEALAAYYRGELKSNDKVEIKG